MAKEEPTVGNWADPRAVGRYAADRARFISALTDTAQTAVDWAAQLDPSTPATLSHAVDVGNRVDGLIAELKAAAESHPTLQAVSSDVFSELTATLANIKACWPADDPNTGQPRTASASLLVLVNDATKYAVTISLPVEINIALDKRTTGQPLRIAELLGTRLFDSTDRKDLLSDLQDRSKEVGGWYDIDSETIYATPRSLRWRVIYMSAPLMFLLVAVIVFWALSRLDNWIPDQFGGNSSWPGPWRDTNTMVVGVAAAVVGALIHAAVDAYKAGQVTGSVPVYATHRWVGWLQVHSPSLIVRILIVCVVALFSLEQLGSLSPQTWLTLLLAGYSADSVLGIAVNTFSALTTKTAASQAQAAAANAASQSASQAAARGASQGAAT